MSVYVSSWAWRQHVGDAAAKLLLLKLADIADDSGECWPGQARLADECEMCDRTIRRKIAELESMGLLAVERRGKKQSNIYRLKVTGQSDRSPSECPDTAMSGSDRTQVSAPPEPSVEPSEEPIASLRSATNGSSSPKRKFSREERNAIFDAVVHACGWDPDRISAKRKYLGMVVSELLELDATPEEVDGFARWWINESGFTVDLTPTCIPKWWPKYCGTKKAAAASAARLYAEYGG